MNVIDFFSGCGGASKGLEQAGCNISLGIDFEPNAASTYKANFPNAQFILDDVRNITVEDIVTKVPNITEEPLLICTCAPCQPFSNQNNKKSDADIRRTLLDETHRFILAFNPEYILLENVPGMQNVNPNVEGPFCRFLSFLSKNGYQHLKFIAKSEEYGVPQKRKRLVLLASRLGRIEEPEKTHGVNGIPYVTVRDAIFMLPPLRAGEVSGEDPVHRCSNLDSINLERISLTPEGGDRRNWPTRLINKAHKDYDGHYDTYGRMSWDKPSPTLTTRCNGYSNGRFGHPDVNQNRPISMREAANLQTFPSDYIFSGTLTSMAKQIGNAVPCELARNFGLAILNHFNRVQEGQE
ncbi:DNA cytosine methyltransferase [Alteromonas sp. M12]|uniref:DNA cytosine methyltransferase n=1 Tax=Alteromonas sp. M12 TaxID=3135644 RepID=UPI00319E85E8